ncbi:MAG: hypothetical protein RLZZ241_2349 [Bacteroidota bacterium]
MRQKIKEELSQLAKDIIEDPGLETLAALYLRSRALYEKVSALKYVEEQLQHLELGVAPNEIGERFEFMANAVLNENKKVPESNPHQEDLIVSGIETIKHMVSEMTDEDELEEVLLRLLNRRGIATNFKKEVSTPSKFVKETQVPKSLNDAIDHQQVKIGLNDRLAFVKQLFDGDNLAFDQAIKELSSMETQVQCELYLEQTIKPNYNNWLGKEEYEVRLKALILRRFI